MAGQTNRRVVVGFVLEGVSGVKQDFNEIKLAAEGFGTEGVKSAQELADAFAAIEAGAEKVAKKITDGKTVTERDLAAMKQAYGLLEGQINATFGSLEKAPEGIRKAFGTAEKQITDSITVINRVAAAAETAEKRFSELGASAGSAFGKIETPAEKVAKGFERWKANLDVFYQKLAEDGDVGLGEIEKIWKAQILFNNELEQSGVTLASLGPEYVAQYQQMTAATDQAAGTVRKLENETDKLKETQIATNKQFTGFGDAIAGLDPQMAKMVLALGSITVAFASAKSAADTMNNFIQTDMQEWDDLTEGVSLKMKAGFEKFFDFIVEGTAAVKAKLDGNQEDYEAAANRAVEASKQFDDAMTKSTEQYYRDAEARRQADQATQQSQEGIQKAVGGTSAEIDKLVTSMRDLAPAGELNSQQLQKLAADLEQTLQKTDNLTEKERERLERVAENVKKFAELTEEQKRSAQQELDAISKLNDKRKEGEGIMIRFSDKQREVSERTREAAENLLKIADNSPRAGRGLEEYAKNADKLEKGLKISNEMVEAMNAQFSPEKVQQINSYADALDRVAQKADAVAAATSKAAGVGGGVSAK